MAGAQTSLQSKRRSAKIRSMRSTLVPRKGHAAVVIQTLREQNLDSSASCGTAEEM